MKTFDSRNELLILRTILEPKAKFRIKALAKLGLDYFGYEVSQEVYKRIITLIQSGRNIPSIDLLKADQVLSEQSRNWLASQGEAIIEESDFSVALEQLSEYRQARIIFDNLNFTVGEMQKEKPSIEKVKESWEKVLLSCNTGYEDDEMFHVSQENIEMLEEKLAEDLEGDTEDIIPTGFREFDKRTGGLKRGQTLYLASVPGGGKSTMMQQMAINQYMMGYNVCVISFEMSEDEMRARMVTNMAKVNHTDYNLKKLNDAEKQLVKKKTRDIVCNELNNRMTIWSPKGDLDVTDIGMHIKPYNYDVVYIDYLGLLKMPKGKQMWEALGDHSRDAKNMARQNNSVVVPLVQFDEDSNRVKYSKAITANADFIWAWDNTLKEQESGVVEIKQIKARGGEQYNYFLQRDFSIMTFSDYSGPNPNESQEEGNKEPELPKMGSLAG